MSSTLTVQFDRIWRRRWLVVVITVLALAASLLSSMGNKVTYTSQALLSASTQQRAPSEDATLAQGYVFYLNDAAHQEKLRLDAGVPDDVSFDGAQFISTSPLFYISATANTASSAQDAAAKMAQTFASEINNRFDENRNAITKGMTDAANKAAADKQATLPPGPAADLAASEADQSMIQLQGRIDDLNADPAGQLTVLKAEGGVTIKGAGKKRGLANGLLGGLLLGCLVAMVAGAATRRLFTADDIVLKTGVRPLEVIPASGSAERDDVRRVRLRHLANVVTRSEADPTRSIAVASAAPNGTGAAQVAAVIAEQRAIQGIPTILVQADLHESRDRSVTGDHPGVADFLRTRVPTALAGFIGAEVNRVQIIGPGRIDDDPYSFFDRPNVVSLVEQATDAAEFVVIEAPPVGSAAEAQVIADVVDRTVLVIEEGKTRVNDVKEAIRTLDQASAAIAGAVLIMAPQRPSRLAALWTSIDSSRSDGPR